MPDDLLDQVNFDACRLEPVWLIRVELGPEDDDRIRLALCEEVRLRYGNYDHVSFETASGEQFFQGTEGTASGRMKSATHRCVRVLSFSITRDRKFLDTAMSAVHGLHSYEEPVIYVQSAFASRSLPGKRQSKYNWWMKSH